MSDALLLTVYCSAIVAASLLGGYVPMRLRLSHTRMQVLMSAVAGFMFGVAVLHMLGHALLEAPPQPVLLWLLAGFLVMFFTERFFAFHVHDPQQAERMLADPPHAPAHHDHPHEHPDPCDHDHAHDQAPRAHRISWTGATIGMTIHSLIGGVALASAVAVGTSMGMRWGGFAVFLATVLHKPLDALTVIALARAGGMRPRGTRLLNLAFSLIVPAGVLLAYLGLTSAFGDHPQWLAYPLAFSAGTFICIALSDLLPEVQFHQHDRVKLSAALLVGLAFAYGAGVVEHTLAHGEHAHGTHDASSDDPGDHAGHADHAGHEH